MLIFKYLPIFLAASVAQAASIRIEGDSDVVHLIRDKRSAIPGRAMMFHGYLGSGGHPYHNPVTQNGRSYNPPQTMTAFAAGDTVSAGPSYYGGRGGSPCRNCNGANKHANGNGYHQLTAPSDKPINGNGQQAPKREEEAGYPNGSDLGEQPAAEETLPPAAPTLPAATEVPKKGPATEESDEEEDEPPFFIRGKGKGKGKGKGLGPSYSSYFPMFFGAYPGRGGNKEDESAYNPGVATAIANSFSTGRGAVATSHATAYGGPHFIPPSYRNNASIGRSH